MLDRFDDDARAAVEGAAGHARRLGHAHVGTEHVLLGLLDGRDDTAAKLEAAGATPDGAQYKVVEAVGTRTAPGGGEPALTARARRALERAGRFSLQRHDAAVGTSHVLLGLLDVEGTACQVLRGLGVDVVALRVNVDGIAAAAPTTAAATTSDGTATPTGATRTKGPVCPSCGADLEGRLAHRSIMASAATQSARDAREVVVVYCESCGSAIGAAPA
jgi:ATP-dependent Clp protease ATP-binding subunit ClpC